MAGIVPYLIFLLSSAGVQSQFFSLNIGFEESAGTAGEARKNSNLVSGSKVTQPPPTTSTLVSTQKVSNISHSNSLNNNTLEQPLKTQTRPNDNDEIVKKRQSNANKLEQLAAKPGPKKTVIQVSPAWPASRLS